MTDDFDKLLGDEETRKGAKDNVPPLPYVEGDFDVTVLNFKSIVNEDTGRKFIAEFVVDASTHELVLPKSRYCLIWGTTGFKGAARMAAERILTFLAACEGFDPKDPSFNPVEVRKAYHEAHASGQTIDSKIRISRRKGKPSKTKVGDDGKPLVYHDDTFTSLAG